MYMGKNVADQVVEMLKGAGIQRIYAVTGDSLNFLNDAIRRDGTIQWIHVRHEETGAYAAGAEAQLTGRLACCAGSSGPGHVHLINGLYDAQQSMAPVIAIASTIHSTEFGSGSFQETHPAKLFDDCSHYCEVANTPKQVPRMLQMAMQTAVSRRGVGVFGLPGDITDAPAEDAITTTEVFPTSPDIVPSAEGLRQAAEVLNRAERVCIFAGIGAADSHAEVLQLAEKLRAPIGYSYRGKMALQPNNPYEIGMTGLLGMPAAYHAMHSADALILLGTDFPYVDFIPKNLKIVQVDEMPERLGRRAKVDVGLHGTCRSAIAALLPLLDQKIDSTYLESELKVHAEVKKGLAENASEAGDYQNLLPEFIGFNLNAMAARDAIFTVDTGMSCVWTARYIDGTGERRMIGSFKHGSMANALAQAIGAQLAFPNRQVIACCGDGGLCMNTGDLATLVQYNLPVKILLFNNRALGMVKLEMEVAGLPDWQTDMVNPDFEILARAYGIPGHTVMEGKEFAPMLKEAFDMPGPVLINVFTDPNALAMPPRVKPKQLLGMAESMSKLMLSGQFSEVWDTVKVNLRHTKEII